MYILVHQEYKLEAEDIFALDGYKITLNKQKMILLNQHLIDLYLRSKYYPALTKIFSKIINFLSDDDENPEDSGLLLDELARERTIILNKYEKYLSEEEKDYYMNPIRLLSNELKNKYYSYTKTHKPLKVK